MIFGSVTDAKAVLGSGVGKPFWESGYGDCSELHSPGGPKQAVRTDLWSLSFERLTMRDCLTGRQPEMLIQHRSGNTKFQWGHQ